MDGVKVYSPAQAMVFPRRFFEPVSIQYIADYIHIYVYINIYITLTKWTLFAQKSITALNKLYKGMASWHQCVSFTLVFMQVCVL